MATDYTSAASSASGHGYAGRTRTDPYPYTSFDSKRWDGKYGAYEYENEILALIASNVSDYTYRQSWTCVSGLAVGDPVYISANATATKALADTEAHAKVFGFCVYKPTTTTCHVSHFRYVSGLTGGTAGAAVYLTDAGGYSASAGTFRREVGVWINTTTAWLFANPLHVLGGKALLPDAVADLVPSFATITKEAEGTPSTDDIRFTIQLQDAQGNSLAAQALVDVWTSGSDKGAPAALTSFTATTGTTIQTVTANAQLRVLSDTNGTIKVVANNGAGAYTKYVMASIAAKCVSLSGTWA